MSHKLLPKCFEIFRKWLEEEPAQPEKEENSDGKE